jgi:hypothetical protein
MKILVIYGGNFHDLDSNAGAGDEAAGRGTADCYQCWGWSQQNLYGNILEYRINKKCKKT